MMPRLSVLLCTRNRGDKIRNAVNSILANTFKDFELLIVDQSTDDKTQSVIKSYSDSRIRYVRTNTVGLARARNIAIRESKTEIVVFTDDDCICDKGWLESIMAEYSKDHSIMGVYGRVLSYGEKKAGMFCQCIIDSIERKVVNTPIIPYDILGHGNNMSFRKEVFRKAGLYIESLGAGTWMKGGEDTDMIYRALRHKIKFCYSPEPLVYHDNWLTTEQTRKLIYGYTMSGTAIFTKYAVKMDLQALKFIMMKGRSSLRNFIYHACMGHFDERIMHELKQLKWFFIGIGIGIYYVFVSYPTLGENDYVNWQNKIIL